MPAYLGTQQACEQLLAELLESRKSASAVAEIEKRIAPVTARSLEHTGQNPCPSQSELPMISLAVDGETSRAKVQNVREDSSAARWKSFVSCME